MDQSRPSPGVDNVKDFGNFIKVYETAEHPLLNVVVSVSLVGGGAALVVGSIALVPEICAAGPLACGAYLYHLPLLIGGGGALVYAGYEYTVHETLPSFKW